MDPQKQREIASKGGKAAHEKGTAHEFTSEEARIAGKKGGAASRARRGKSENENGSAMTQEATEAGSEAAVE
jgi:general stress protein YciG